jgi:thioredoxin 1
MTTIHATEKNFQSLIDKGGVLLVDFWAEWCGPCKSFGPVFEAASVRHPGAAFAKVDTEEEQGLAQAFGVRAIPMLAVFRDGVLLFSQSGALPAEALDELVTQALALDMDKVRAEIAASEPETT